MNFCFVNLFFSLVFKVKRMMIVAVCKDSCVNPVVLTETEMVVSGESVNHVM